METSLVQAAQAQQVAGRARDRERAERENAARRFRDLVELRVGSVLSARAARKLPANESEEAEVEQRGHDTEGEGGHGGRVDVQA